MMILSFNLAFGLWFLIGLLFAGISVGYHSITWDDIDFNEGLRLLIIFLIGPINIVIAIGRFIGCVFSDL